MGNDVSRGYLQLTTFLENTTTGKQRNRESTNVAVFRSSESRFESSRLRSIVRIIVYRVSRRKIVI